MASTQSPNGTTTVSWDPEIQQDKGINQLLGLKAKQSIARNLEREDAAIRREEQHMETLLYSGDGGSSDSSGTDDTSEDAEGEMPVEDEGFRANDIAGNVDVHIHQSPVQEQKSNSMLPLILTSALAGLGGGAGLAALAYQMTHPSEKTEIVIPTPDTDTTGTIGVDK